MGEMKKVFLHVGLHKTGSSSIQTSLFKSRLELEKQGFSYFCEDFDGKEKALPQHWVHLDQFNVPTIKEMKKFNSLIASQPSQNVIVSIEALAWFMNVESVKNVRTALKGFDVEVIVYLRRQDKQMVSYHQEGSKDRIKPSAVYYGSSLHPFQNLKRKEYLDYETRMDSWASVFGKGNITVKIFEPDLLDDKDVVKDFCNQVGLVNIPSIRVNESLGFEATKIGQLINLSGLRNAEWSKKIRKACSNEGKLLPSRAEAQKFYDEFKESNSSLNSKFNINQSSYLFDEDFSSYPEDGQYLWTEESANQAIIKILKLLDKKSEAPDSYVNLLRDDALKLEKSDLGMAYSLMKRALELRPHGPLIKKKVAEYEEKLGIQTK